MTTQKMTYGRAAARRLKTVVLCLCALAAMATASAKLTQWKTASLVIAGKDPLVQKSAAVLAEEIAKRTGLALPSSATASAPAIVVGTQADIAALDENFKSALDALPPTDKDGYLLAATKDGTHILVAGHDPRGTLYGVGRLLRLSDMRAGSLEIDDALALSSTPKYPVRGHEMTSSPRAKSAEEAWAKANFDQYVRELALFGMNAVELSRMIPPDYVRIAKSYGLDVWIVTYYKGGNFDTPQGQSKELQAREKLLRRTPAVDHWFIKTGDPGSLPMDQVFTFAAKEAALVKRLHPGAKIWMGPQHFVRAPQSYFDSFCEYANKAPWLDGVVFGPWCRMSFEELRAKIRPGLPIRNFPDITHIYADQYPLRSLDLTMATTLGRICINPTPEGQKCIHNLYAPLGVGSLTYSEGTNDDLNKFLWLDQDWDPSRTATASVADYARFFFGSDVADDYAKGTLALEQNLIGPVDKNASIMDTLALWQSLEKRADPCALKNPRFLMPLLRAYYDAYIYQRRVRELALEGQAYDALRAAPQTGAAAASAKARAILAQAHTPPVAPELKQRCLELYEGVYNDPGRWTMEYQHCPLMEQIEAPLNDAPWMLAQLDEIDALADEPARLARIDALVRRTDPGPGGFYYNLGDFSSESVTGIEAAWKTDPAYLKSPHCGYGVQMKKGFVITPNGVSGKPVPRAWLTQAGIYWDQPLSLIFKGFDPAAAYRMRVVYTGEASRYKSYVSLKADGETIHEPFRLQGDEVREFDLPPAVTRDGQVTLTWQSAPGERAVHIAEIFFFKNPPPASASAGTAAPAAPASVSPSAPAAVAPNPPAVATPEPRAPEELL